MNYEIDKNKCSYCGNYHTGTCQRVAAIEYFPNGMVKRVEFHPNVQTITNRKLKCTTITGQPKLNEHGNFEPIDTGEAIDPLSPPPFHIGGSIGTK